MSYQVLARKWRPRQFSELVGQQHVKTALANALTNSRLHHAYLFTGTRGVGKTTIARIFAKSLNCETGITATPCGVCSTCLEIDAGNFVDLMEIDAASRTKVEDTRDLLDNVQYAPSRGRFKVYLIDEVHMLSRHSFNALLKTLEEPPPHVKFLLATTDPQKLPITVLSRCLQFSLKALTVAQIEQHLAEVLTAEHIPFERSALALIAKAARGSLRDSLSLTDQAIALSNSNLQLEPIRQMLGLLDTSWSAHLLSALLAGDFAQLQQVLQALLAEQSDYQQVLDDMLGLLHLAAITQLQPAAAQLSEQSDFVTQLAQQQAPEALQLFYQLLLSGKKDLPFAPEPLIGLEMALLRAMAFVPAAQRTSDKLAPCTIEPAATAPLEKSLTAPIPVAAVAPVIAAPNVPVSSAEPAISEVPAVQAPVGGIDPLTARIMQRRGVAVPSMPSATPSNIESGIAAEKKFERPAALNTTQARLVAAQQRDSNLPQGAIIHETTLAETSAEKIANAAQNLEDDNSHDDSVSFAEQQALTEAWWQQQSFMPLPSADADLLDEQRFSIRFAAQVDAWSRLVEQLAIGGLMRLYLLHSAMQQQDKLVQLTVAQSQQHLDNPEFRQKLHTAISPVFAAGFELHIHYQAEVVSSPLAIQQRIELERKAYVSQLLQQDPNIQAIQQRFAAQLQLDTLQVN